ncbi:MAG: OsmC family protein [Gammaproteobacteria bacterium]|nr:OsmC family protein [Gammaproteobacteria bacterium]
MKAEVNWNGGMSFTGSGACATHSVVMDAPPAVGGSDNGIRPKELLLHSLAGCTAMDVISILHKMKLEPNRFRVEATATESEEHPKVFTSFHLRYLISGGIPEEKLNRAIELSQTRYCGVSAMFRNFAPVTHEVCYE